MPEPTLTDVAIALARMEGKLDGLSTADDKADALLKEHGSRIDKLERIAYVALGVAIASSMPQLVSVFTK